MMKNLLLLIILQTSIISGWAQVVTNTADAGSGSLRQAILDANGGLGNGEISFQIPSSDPGYDTQRGVYVISPQTLLPAIQRSGLLVNGASQTEFTGNTNAAQLGRGGNSRSR